MIPIYTQSVKKYQCEMVKQLNPATRVWIKNTKEKQQQIYGLQHLKWFLNPFILLKWTIKKKE